MSRNINADALIEKIKRCLDTEWDGGTSWKRAYSEFIDMIDDIPTADVVEVVHCKDCIHYCGYFSKNEVLHCGVFDWLSLPYDYCSTGERREDE